MPDLWQSINLSEEAMSLKNEFIDALDKKFGEYDLETALWAARWAIELCAHTAENHFGVRHDKDYVFCEKQIAEKLRSLAKELE